MGTLSCRAHGTTGGDKMGTSRQNPVRVEGPVRDDLALRPPKILPGPWMGTEVGALPRL